MLKKLHKTSGFSLIELIFFLVIVGIIISLFIPLTLTLKTSHRFNEETKALMLARERMEIILATKANFGFTNLSDPCQTNNNLPSCQIPSDYQISTNIAPITWQGDANNFKQVAVTVSGKGNAKLRRLVGNN